MADSILNVTYKIVAYDDKTTSSNPRLRLVDWTRDMSGLVAGSPKTEKIQLLPLETKVIFDGTRTTTIAGDTTFSVSLSTLDPSRYRIAWTGGTNPTLRTDRGLALSGVATTVTINANATANISTPSPQFAGVVVGDTVFIPHTTTGDSANVFSVANAGWWTVIAVSSTSNIQVARFSGMEFSGTSETQTPSSNTQLQAFSASGVQVGDAVDISSGFSFQQTLTVQEVTANFIEVISTTPLPTETGATPTASGMIFYTDTKNFVYVETDQDALVRLNGATGNNDRLSPREAGNSSLPGVFMKMGPTWSMSLVNRTTTALNAIIIYAE